MTKIFSIKGAAFLLALALLVAIPGLVEAQAPGEGGEGLDYEIPFLKMTATDRAVILSTIAKMAKLSITTTESVKGKQDVNLPENTTVRVFMEDILPGWGYAYHQNQDNPRIITVGTPAEIATRFPIPEVMVEKTVTIEYAGVEQIIAAIRDYKSPKGKITFDKKTNQIFLTDLAPNVEKILQLIRELDVETEQRIFRLQWADPIAVQKQLKGIISPDPDAIIVDKEQNLIILNDIKSKVERAAQIIAELDKARDVRIFTIHFADPKDIMKLLKDYLSKEGNMQFDERTRKLVIEDISSKLDRIAMIIRELDEAPRQVFLEAEIVEINDSYDYTLGVNWEIAQKGETGDLTNDDSILSTQPLLQLIGGQATYFDLDSTRNFRAQINAMVASGKGNILASPRILVKDLEEAQMNVADEIPYGVVTSRGTGNNTREYFTARYKTVGVILNVIPKITSNGYVEMEIELENSDLIGFIDIGGTKAPSTTEAKAETVVTVRSGRTVVIGGLIRNGKTQTSNGIPFLSQIPILGMAFGNTSYSVEKRKLLLFITPHIVSIDNPYDFKYDYDSPGAQAMSPYTQDRLPIIDWDEEEAAMEEPIINGDSTDYYPAEELIEDIEVYSATE